MRRLGIVLSWAARSGLFLFAASIASACSDDGEPADDETLSGPDDGGSGDDGVDDGDATSPTVTDTADDTDPTDPSETADDGPSSTDDGTTSPGDSSGDGSSTDDTGPGPAVPCASDDECVVVEDCCNCGVAPASDPPTCDIPECRQSTCDAIGFEPVAQCELGSCEPVPVPCDASQVFCDSLPPDCNDGFLPGVDTTSNCWTGSCVPAEACDIVPGCADCPEDEACVQYVTQLGPQYHCSPIPEDCGGVPSCACMAEACVAPFDSCGDGDEGPTCSCPVCG
jgi:hypothetical protein